MSQWNEVTKEMLGQNHGKTGITASEGRWMLGGGDAMSKNDSKKKVMGRGRVSQAGKNNRWLVNKGTVRKNFPNWGGMQLRVVVIQTKDTDL